MIPAVFGYATIGLCLATLAALFVELLQHLKCHMEGKPLPARANLSQYLLCTTAGFLAVNFWWL